MIINNSEPWLLWPDKVSYGLNKGEIGKTFEGYTDFTLAMNIKILTKSETKRTMFAKLPNYCGVDLESNNKLLLILKLLKNNEETYRYIISDESLNDDYNMIIFRYLKHKNIVDVSINDNVVIQYNLENNEQLTIGNEPHIIFGSGNFPHNGFNLNYCSYDINFLLISKSYKLYDEILIINNNIMIDESIIGLYDFNKYTDFKVYDLSENCNFLHKIIE